MLINNSTPKEDGYYMPAEFSAHKGTLMIYPTRPGSWGKDRTDTLKSFGQVFLEIIKRETLYLLTSEDYVEEAIDTIEHVIYDYAAKCRENGNYEAEAMRLINELGISEDEQDELITLEDLLEGRCEFIPIESDDVDNRDVQIWCTRRWSFFVGGIIV